MDLLIRLIDSKNKNDLEKLLDKGFDISNNRISTIVIHRAIEKQSTECLIILLKNGANPNAKNNDGQTALIHSTCLSKNYNEFVKILLDFGADPNIPDNVFFHIFIKIIFHCFMRYEQIK